MKIDSASNCGYFVTSSIQRVKIPVKIVLLKERLLSELQRVENILTQKINLDFWSLGKFFNRQWAKLA